MFFKNMTEEQVVDLPIYDLYKLLEEATASDVLVVRGILQNAKNLTEGLANKFTKRLIEHEGENDDNLTMVIQCYAQAMYIEKKLELCKKFSELKTPKCFLN